MRRVLSIGAAAPLATAAAALAAEGGNENLFAGDLGNAVWTLVIFVAVILVLGKFAWGPLLETLQKREEFIRESLQKARADREEAKAQLEEYTRQMRESRAQATAIVEEGRRDAEELRRKIEADAREEAERLVERARREIDLAKQTALKEIYEGAARFATQAAAKVIGREVAEADHERLIAESIASLEDLDAN
ncbi:MAG: F0F1 ATP synthase subunit B [Thermoanaerobaculia bacterium]|nr:F0F1 ATP synthase subunit B [Thermoanaerobaculia bacterium]